MVSWSYEATGTSELGNQVTLSSVSEPLSSVNVTMSSWACQNGSWDGTAGNCVSPPGATFAVPITFTIYNVDAGNTVGSVLATDTQTFNIPYRPSGDSTDCQVATEWYDAADSTCYNGFATNIAFNFSRLVTLPSSTVIYGISFSSGPGPQVKDKE